MTVWYGARIGVAAHDTDGGPLRSDVDERHLCVENRTPLDGTAAGDAPETDTMHIL